jgi:hypothetical protein
MSHPMRRLEAAGGGRPGHVPVACEAQSLAARACPGQ